MRLYPADTPAQFEFDKIQQLIHQYCRTNGARKMADTLSPIENKEKLTAILGQVNEYTGILAQGNFFPSTQFPEITKEVELLRISNGVLNEKEFLNIREISEICNSLLRFFKDKETVLPNLHKLLENIYLSTDIINLIDAIIAPPGEVKSTASTNLARIRRELSIKRREVEKLFQQQVQKYRKLGYLADTEETVHNGHRVLAVLSEHKRIAKGIVVGSSDTGKTTFIEPIETLDLNNEVFELEQEEKREIFIILRNLTNQVRVYRDLIRSYLLTLTIFDFVRAKALLARDLDACLPQIAAKPVIRLFNAKHPLLLLQNKKASKTTIPLELELDTRQRILVISGPNSGGKSIALKTVGLLQMMLQSGLLVPCEEKSEMCFFDFLLSDIGDSQSIENELSTYSSRLMKMRRFVDLAGRNTLFLIDEFGTGSDPELGGAIAEALLEDLTEKKSFGLITTHYSNIKLAADKLPGVINGCMLFDEETLHPLYILNVGQPGSSYTFQVAERIGLHKHLITNAKSKVKAESLQLDKILASLQRDKSSFGRKLNDLETKLAKANEAKQKYDELFAKYKDLMDKRKSGREEDLKLMELGRKLRVLMNEYEFSKDKKGVIKKLAKMAEEERMKRMERKSEDQRRVLTPKQIESYSEHIKPGNKVKIYGGQRVGVIESVEKDKARVIFDNVKSVVDIKKLVPVVE